MQGLSDIKPSLFVSFFGQLMLLFGGYSPDMLWPVVVRVRVRDSAYRLAPGKAPNSFKILNPL